MRLIDADKLMENMKGTNRYFDVKFDIEEAPTVDAELVVHSHWEVAIGYDPKKKVQCQNCMLMNYEPEDFCPHCGARMDGETE